MAKGNMLLGQLRGSIGDVTFSRLNGTQVSRARNRQPNNPQTDNQMTQRVILKTASMAYSVLAANFSNQTFQGAAVGQENQRRFLSRNIRYISEVVEAHGGQGWNFAGKSQTSPLINPYVVSEGNLPDPYLQIVNPGGENFCYLENLRYELANYTDMSYQQVCDMLGLPAGAQLTFAFIYGHDQNIEYVRRQRIILMPSTGDMGAAFFAGDAEQGGHAENVVINMANPDNETDLLLSDGLYQYGRTMIAFNPINDNADLLGAVCVASYKTGSTWRYSESGICPNPAFPAGLYPIGDAVNSYSTRNLVASNEYTRQASQESSVTESASEVTSILARVYQTDEDGAYRTLINQQEVNGSTVSIRNIAMSAWKDIEEAGNSLEIDLSFYGNMTRSFTADNLEFAETSPLDASTVARFAYTAGTKSYNVRMRVGFAELEGTLAQVVNLADNNGVVIASVNVTLENLPFPLRILGLFATESAAADELIADNIDGEYAVSTSFVVATNQSEMPTVTVSSDEATVSVVTSQTTPSETYPYLWTVTISGVTSSRGVITYGNTQESFFATS